MARSHKILGLKVSAEELERFRQLQRARGDTTDSATLRALILTAPIPEPRQEARPNLGSNTIPDGWVLRPAGCAAPRGPLQRVGDRLVPVSSAAVEPRQQPDPEPRQDTDPTVDVPDPSTTSS